jgi:hypothetical protein
MNAQEISNSSSGGCPRINLKQLFEHVCAPATSLVICLVSLLLIAPVQAADSLDLEGTTITGNQELPKALHIVPWKSAEAGDLAGRPLNSLIDEILAPIDRDVFLRELEYYEAVHSSE